MTSTPTTAATGAEAIALAALDWYDANGRDLAFRRSVDPWAVLVSEVMAQQTQAERAAKAWSTFIARYPAPAALARASVAEVIRAWRGLGYNRRAVALRAAAVRMVDDHGGAVPDTLEALQGLPGIGPYTARAVLAIAFGRPVAALDTNIQRVLGRSIGGLPPSPRERQSTADGFVPPDRPAAWTHALMDIGATLCRKRDPRCGECPLAGGCAFVRSNGGSAALAPAPRTRTPAPRFESTTRWLRGRILDQLREAPDGTWSSVAGPIGLHDEPSVQRAVAALAHEGFLELDPADRSRARLVSPA
ncbi:MAG TPA: A/G-specific adenine glycosylase [Candidatus Limnocylindrales bacterium]|nr:A/G-specific adenine glycosylase [Candidatus Limnocylindrales bacterium]